MHIFLLILILLAYPLVAHGMIIGGVPDIAVKLLVLLGLLSIVTGLVRGSKQKPDQLKLLVYVVIILWGITNLITESVHVLFVPSVTINIVIALVIVASLRDGVMPMMERIIRLSAVEELPELVVREARLLTMIWAAFFFLMAAISLILAVWADLGTWSLFANVLYFVFLALIILCTHSYQYLRYRKLGIPINWQSAYKSLSMDPLLRRSDHQMNKGS